MSLNPFTLHEVLSEMETLGQALGLGSGAQEVVAGLRRRAEEAQAKAQSFGPAKHQKVRPSGQAFCMLLDSTQWDLKAQPTKQRLSPHCHHPSQVAFLEWTDPLFMGGHWTPQLIHMAGGSHPLNPPSGPGGAAGPSTAQPAERLLVGGHGQMAQWPCPYHCLPLCPSCCSGPHSAMPVVLTRPRHLPIPDP